MDIEIKRAGNNDLQTIHDMAEIVFRQTYRSILSPEQMEYMMDWMYSLPNLEKQVSQGILIILRGVGWSRWDMFRCVKTLLILMGQRFGIWRRFMLCRRRRVAVWDVDSWRRQKNM